MIPDGGLDGTRPVGRLGDVLREPAAGQPRGGRDAAGPPGLPGAELAGEAGQPGNRPVEAAGAADVGQPELDAGAAARALVSGKAWRGDPAAGPGADLQQGRRGDPGARRRR